MLWGALMEYGAFLGAAFAGISCRCVACGKQGRTIKSAGSMIQTPNPKFQSLRLKPPTPQENKCRVWGLVVCSRV